MAAPRRIEWTERAERDLERIHAFVLERWSEREATHLLDLVQEFEWFVARWPHGFKRSQRLHTIGWGSSIGIPRRSIAHTATA